MEEIYHHYSVSVCLSVSEQNSSWYGYTDFDAIFTNTSLYRFELGALWLKDKVISQKSYKS